MAIPWIPGISKVLKFEHPDPEFYAFLVAIVAVYSLLVQTGKTIYLKFFKTWIQVPYFLFLEICLKYCNSFFMFSRHFVVY